ncbi:MAG: DUF6493 family protein [Tannerella sp.]|jgi:hypothetical protein|nr:DUF6493 family protein [Tannerella sp.]
MEKTIKILEQFRTIYHNDQTERIIPFLKKLNAKDKKEIAKELIKINDKEKINVNIDAFWIASVICCTKTQFRALTNWHNTHVTEFVDQALEWNCPEWFSEIYNKSAEEDYWLYIHYPNLVRWQQKGFLQPSGKLIARSLTDAICSWNQKTYKSTYTPEIVSQNPITLDEHIWTLFEYVTSIDWRDTNQYHGTNLWKNVFLKQSQNGHIDRIRLLKACLNTVIQDFKRDLAGWYVDLFIYLQPTDEELLTIQDELFATFMGKYPKMTNRVLDFIKKIAGHKDFHTDSFVSQTGLLLSSDVKSIVNSTLAILDKAAESHIEKRTEICTCLPLVFLNKDESIQTRAAKIIMQYGNPSSPGLQETLHTYNTNILMSVREILKDFLADMKQSITSDGTVVFDKIHLFDNSLLIPVPETMDDLIFFLLQLFENGKPYQIDLLPATLIHLTKEINGTNVNQLERPLQKAYEICLSKPFHNIFEHKTNEFEKTYFWGAGSYYNLAALFFVQYCQHLTTLYPNEAAFIKEMHEEAVANDKREAQRTKGGIFQYDCQITLLNDWIYSKYKLFYAYHQVMLQALSFIEKGIRLPLLSTPTHLPCWIAPKTFIDRLMQYQQADQTLDPADLQLALARIAPESIPVVTRLAEEKLNEKYANQLLAFYAGEAFPEKEKTPCTLTNIKNYASSYPWSIADEKKMDSTYTEHFVLEMSIPPSPWIEEKNHYAGISDRLRLCIGTQDVTNFIYSYPAIPAIPFAMIVKDRFEFAQMPDAEFRDFLTASVAALFDMKVEIRSATSVFLACCMLCSEKTIRNYAAEIWIERTTGDQINNIELGNHIGRLGNAEWAPVKRLTELIDDRMIYISPKHNQALEQLVISILSQIKKPITNLKKLLEIYSELLSVNQSGVDFDKIPQLSDWVKENNLKKIVKQITR